MTAGLPDFLVVGAPKSGTTSLYRYLEGHPDVYLSPVKEPRYFAFPDTPPRFVGPGAKDLNREIVWREDDYRALFAGRQPHHRAGGEASATYLWAPGAAERIARTVPESRLIAILRQPADRAFSTSGTTAPGIASRSRVSRRLWPQSPSDGGGTTRSTSTTRSEVSTALSWPGTCSSSLASRYSSSSSRTSSEIRSTSWRGSPRTSASTPSSRSTRPCDTTHDGGGFGSRGCAGSSRASVSSNRG